MFDDTYIGPVLESIYLLNSGLILTEFHYHTAPTTHHPCNAATFNKLEQVAMDVQRKVGVVWLKFGCSVYCVAVWLSILFAGLLQPPTMAWL